MNSNLTSKQFNQEDLCSTVYVDNLLSGVNEWRNIQEIVRTTIKSLTDVVKAQGIAIKELEKQVNSKASKIEMINGLGSKANINDVMRTFNEVAASIDSRPTVEEVNYLLDEKVNKADLIYSLNSKPSFEDVRTMLLSKTQELNFKDELEQEFNKKLDELNRENNKKLSQLALSKDLQQVVSLLETKANTNDVNEALSSKASKESVVSALQRKMNKSEVDAIINSKVDYIDFQNLVSAVKLKAESGDLEKLEAILDSKVERNELLGLSNLLNNKIDFKDYETLNLAINELRSDVSKKTNDLDLDLDRLIENIKKEFSNINQLISTIDQSKLEPKDLDKIYQQLSKKVDYDHFQNVISNQKEDLAESLSLIRNDNSLYFKQFDDKLKDVINTMEKQYSMLVDDFNHKLNKINDEFIKLNSELPELNNKLKNALQSQSKDFINDIAFLKDELVKLCGDIEDLNTIKADKKDLESLKNLCLKDIDSKVNATSLDNLYKTLLREINEKNDDAKNIVNKALKNFENDIFKLLDKKANQFDVTNALNSKADFGVTQIALQSKASYGDVEKIRNAVEKLIKDISNKLDCSKFELFVRDVKKKDDDISRDLLSKATVKEMISMLKNKADIDDVNKALSQVHEELDLKSNQEQVRF